MTHPEKLNGLLHVLLWLHRKVVVNEPISKKVTFAFLCKTVAEVTEAWEIEFLRKRLLTDGYITMGKYGDGEPPELTPQGIKFIQSGGYIQEKKDIELERLTKLENLKSLKRSKASLWISIVAVVVPTVISIYTVWLTKQSDNTEEVKLLRQRLDTIQAGQSVQQRTLDALQNVAYDTLQKGNRGK